jgi:periplasmic protein TonB
VSSHRPRNNAAVLFFPGVLLASIRGVHGNKPYTGKEAAMAQKSPFTEEMFAHLFLETPWDQHTRRSWTTLTSLGLQAAIISLLLVLPLLKSVGPPSSRVLPTPLSWGAPPAAMPAERHPHPIPPPESNIANTMLIAPGRIPPQVEMVEEAAPPPQVNYEWGVGGGTGVGSRDGIWRSLSESLDRAAPLPFPAAAPPARHFRPSSILEGSLIRRLQPSYPPLARTAHIHGSVVLSAIISKTGAIRDLRVLSGHPLLVAAAIDAVSQWRYRPYILNGEPVEVETHITVNFILSGN